MRWPWGRRARERERIARNERARSELAYLQDLVRSGPRPCGMFGIEVDGMLHTSNPDGTWTVRPARGYLLRGADAPENRPR